MDYILYVTALLIVGRSSNNCALLQLCYFHFSFSSISVFVCHILSCFFEQALATAHAQAEYRGRKR